MTIAVIPEGGTEPAASFEDMQTALAWGLQQYKGKAFVVRVFTGEETSSTRPSPPPPPRKPSTSAVAQVLRQVNKTRARDED